MSDSDLVSLYSDRILELAASIPHLGRLAEAGGAAQRRSPLCGSTLSVEVRTLDGRISEFAQEVRACALGQASASILGRVVIGRSLPELERARSQLDAMLAENGPVPDAPFEGYKALVPARDYRNRHASILLALDATCAAMAEALGQTG